MFLDNRDKYIREIVGVLKIFWYVLYLMLLDICWIFQGWDSINLESKALSWNLILHSWTGRWKMKVMFLVFCPMYLVDSTLNSFRKNFCISGCIKAFALIHDIPSINQLIYQIWLRVTCAQSAEHYTNNAYEKFFEHWKNTLPYMSWKGKSTY